MWLEGVPGLAASAGNRGLQLSLLTGHKHPGLSGLEWVRTRAGQLAKPSIELLESWNRTGWGPDAHCVGMK